MRPDLPPTRASGFTLVELLVAVAIVAILAVMLLPVLGKARQGSQRSACLSSLHQIGLATTLYQSDNAGKMPPVPDAELQMMLSGDAFGKRYHCIGSFMPLLHPHAPNSKMWLSPPVFVAPTNEGQAHFLSPLFEKSWWDEFMAQRSIRNSVLPSGGWSADNGGRNQICLEMYACWVRRNIDRWATFGGNGCFGCRRGVKAITKYAQEKR